MRHGGSVFVCILAAACGETLPADVDPSSDAGADGNTSRAGASDAGAPDARADADTDALPASDAGRCTPQVLCDGGCAGRCPSGVQADPDFLVSEGADGGFIYLRNERDCNHYRCTDGTVSDAGFDCSNPPVGYRSKVCSTGTCPTVGVSRASAACGVESCTYNCIFVP